jgi:nucleoside-diphosphate-sugar epimerase
LIGIVGGRGVIGSTIAEAMRAAGHDVAIITHNRGQATAPGYRFADVLAPDSLASAVEGLDVVIQSMNFPTYPIEKPRLKHTFMNFDGLGTERLVAAAEAGGARSYVFISGVGTCADSPSPFYQAIWRGEQAVLRSKLEGICIRPTLVYGPNDKGLNRILRAARRLPLVPVVGDGQQLHQPVHVKDVAEVVRQAIDNRIGKGVFEVGGPERMTLNEMLAFLFNMAGMRRQLLHIPISLARLGGGILQGLPGPLLTAAAVDFIAGDFVADLDALRATFKLRLTPFAEGLAKYLQKQPARS